MKKEIDISAYSHLSEVDKQKYEAVYRLKLKPEIKDQLPAILLKKEYAILADKHKSHYEVQWQQYTDFGWNPCEPQLVETLLFRYVYKLKS